MRGEILFCEVDDLVTNIIVTCNDETAIREDQCVTDRAILHATDTLVLDIGGVNVVKIT